MLACGLLAACASRPAPVEPSEEGASAVAGPFTSPLADWSLRVLPGKPQTRYVMSERAGRPCVQATSERSASLLRRVVDLPADRVARIEFDWWIDHAPTSAPDQEPLDDAAARLVLGFDGDEARLSVKDRLMFDLARTVTGESPPYASLIYVWDARLAPDELRVSERSDRLRKIAVAGSPQPPGVWLHLRRDLVTDFSRAYGEAPGRLVGLALMTDSDNTGSSAQACYGDIRLYDRDGRLLDGSLVLSSRTAALGLSR